MTLILGSTVHNPNLISEITAVMTIAFGMVPSVTSNMDMQDAKTDPNPSPYPTPNPNPDPNPNPNPNPYAWFRLFPLKHGYTGVFVRLDILFKRTDRLG